MAAGHLVTRLQAALDGQVDLDHLQHTRGQLVTLGELLALLFEGQVELVTLLLDGVLHAFQPAGVVLVGQTHLEPVVAVQILQVVAGDDRALGQLLGSAIGFLAVQETLDPAEGVVLDDPQLVVQVQTEALELVVDDRLRPLVPGDALAGEHLHVDDSAVHARRHAQAGVLHIGGLLAEDRTQQLLFRGELGLALGRDLAHQRVAGRDFGTDVDDAGLVQTGQLALGQVGDVAGDFLGPQLGVTRQNRQLLDVDRGVAVVGHHLLGDHHRVLEVVAVPGHERDQHVLPQGQLAEVGRCAVGDHVAGSQPVALGDNRTLVDVGVLVAAGVLDEVVDVHAHFARRGFLVVDADHHPVGIDVVDDTAAQRSDDRARVHRTGALDAGTNQRFLRTQAGHGLTLHVGAHQRAVRVVVLKERNQRGGHRHDLRRRHVDVLHAVGRDQLGLAVDAHRHQLAGQAAFLVQLGVGLSDDVAALFDGRQEVDLVGELLVLDLAVRGLQEAELVQAGIERQRVDQTDVRTFRRLDRADAAVVGRVHVAHLEAGTLTRQTARAQGRDTALVGDLRQRVGLVHELGQLAGTEELADGGADRLAVDQVMRQQVLGLGLAQTLAHGALDTHQTGTELVLGQLAHAAHATVAQVVDVVDLALAVAQVHQQLDDSNDVVVFQRHGARGLFAADAAVELHPAHARQVVGVLVVEQAIEQRLDRVLGRRLARTHHPVDGDAGRDLVGGVIQTQGLRDERARVQVIGVERAELVDVGRAQATQAVLGQLVVGAHDDLAGLGIDDVGGHGTTQQKLVRHADQLQAGLFHVADVLGIDPLVLGNDDVAFTVGDVETGRLTLQTLGHQLHLGAFRLQREGVEDEEVSQDLLRRHADGLQQDRHRHLAATVDTEVQDVLGVKLEVQPRATVGDDPCREEQLAGAVGLAAVVLEEHAGRTMQLRDDNTLGTVDDEGAGRRHERDLAHVDFLLLHFLDRGLAGLAVHDDQAHTGAQRCAEVQAALLALLHVEGRLAQRVADELQTRHVVVRRDRKDRLQCRL